MKKAKQRMLIGGILIALQLLSLMGTALAGDMPSFDDGFAFLLGYFLIGIIGVVLLIQGIRMLPNGENKDDSDSDKKE